MSSPTPVRRSARSCCRSTGALSPREVAQIVDDAEPGLLLVDDAFAGLVAESGYSGPRIDFTDPERLGADASPAFAARPVDPEAPTLLLYTSGTTGMPKGVLISQTNLSYVERMAREVWAFDRDSVNLVAMPLFHIGGIGYGMMALSQGGHTVLLNRLDPPGIVETVNRHRVSHAFFVPTVVQRLVDYVEAGGEAPRGLKRILYGAAPIGEPLLRRAIAAFGCGFSHAYGATRDRRHRHQPAP